MSERDMALEEAARAVERGGPILVMGGIGARRKAVREAAASRIEGWQAAQRDFAEAIRCLKGDRSMDLAARLAEVAEQRDVHPFTGHDYGRLWPLLEDRLIEVSVVVPLFGNSIPPGVTLNVALTDRGRRVLENKEAA